MPPSRQCPLLAERNHPIREPSNFLRLGLSRLDAVMFEQRGHETSEQGPPMFGLSSELSAFFSVTHGFPLVSLLALQITAIGLHSIQLDTETQAHFRQDFFNFIERFLTEILRPQHLPFGLLN